MKSAFVLILVLTIQIVGARDSVPSNDSIKELITIDGFKKNHNDYNENVQSKTPVMLKRLLKKKLNASSNHKPVTLEQEQFLKTKYVEMLKFLDHELSWEIIEPAVIKSYAETYTQEEVDGNIDFYSRPQGMIILKKQKSIDLKVANEIEKIIGVYSMKIDKVMSDLEKLKPQ